MILVILLFIITATAFTFGKAALDYADPLFLIGVRMTIAGLLLLGYQYFFNYPKWRLPLKNYFLWLQVVLFHIYITYALEFWGMQWVNSAKVCLLYNLSPFITALFSWYLLKERLTIKQYGGLVIGFFGFLPTLIAQAPLIESFKGQIGFLSISEIAVLFSVVSSAYGWIIVRNLTVEKKYPPVMINGIAMLGGGILSLLTSLLVEGWPHVKLNGHISTVDIYLIKQFGIQYAAIIMFGIYILFLILFINIFVYNFYGLLLNRYSATLLSFAGMMTPLFAALFGWLWLNETVTWHFFATVVFVAFGLYLFYQDELRLKKS